MSFDRMRMSSLEGLQVSIPLEQGNVFRHEHQFDFTPGNPSQSLWNRAMSFDFNAGITILDSASQSLWNRAMSFDY